MTELESQAQAFSDLSRTLAEAIEQAFQQASEIIRRAQEHASGLVTLVDRRVAEGLRQATAVEKRAAAAQQRLVALETRIDQAQAKLSQIGAQLSEIGRLVMTREVGQETDDRGQASTETPLGRMDRLREHHEAPFAADPDPLKALALLRDAVDAAS